MKKQSEVRTTLQNHNIKYDVKIKNLLSPSIFSRSGRTYIGSRGVDLTKSYEYKIYVKKSDWTIVKQVDTISLEKTFWKRH